MRNYIFAILVLFAALSCKQSKSPVSIEREYLDTFYRGEDSAPVEVTLEAGNFTGEIRNRFPAICRGNYTFSGNTISFQDACIWTADFDWTLILSGTWHYSRHNDLLTLENINNGNGYILIKQEFWLTRQILLNTCFDSSKNLDKVGFVFFQQRYAEALQVGGKRRNGHNAYIFGG